jgi:CBS domain containing-hemolysin-like protein
MPDSDPPSSSSTIDRTAEPRNLPAVITAPAEHSREGGESFFSRWFRTLFGWRNGSVRADLKVVLEEAAPTDTGFSPEEITMLRNILGLRERRISDVMVPRADIVAVQQETPIGELVKVFEGAGHSRLVVFNDTLDDPVGMVHIRDLIAFMTARATVSPAAKSKRKKSPSAGLDLKAIDLSMPLSAAKIVRPILFVPPSMPAIDLLAKMQATRIHLALVVDEYGGTDGIVSIEDIVEQIVGEIDDEHDDDEAPSVVQQADGSFVADARANLEDVIAIIGNGFDVGEAAKDVDTLGGYLVTQIGRVPVRGEVVPGPGIFEFEVLDADPRRVKKVRIHSGKIPRASRLSESRKSGAGATRKQNAVQEFPADAAITSEPTTNASRQP